MFTIILYYFIVAMLGIGAFINFILWLGELKDAYNHRRVINELVKDKF